MWTGQRSLMCVLLIASVVAEAGEVRAGDAVAARDAYDRGSLAYDDGDFGRAALAFAEADALAPNGTALEFAIRSALRADDARLAMILVRRAQSRTSPETLVATAQAARQRLVGKTGAISVRCRTTPPCSAMIDGKRASLEQPEVVLTGEHTVRFDLSDGRETVTVRVEGDATVYVAPNERTFVPVVASREDQPRSAGPPGVSPFWFWLGAGTAGLLAAGAVASFVDADATHDAFVARPTDALSATGEAAQLRTNLLWAGAGVTTLATAVVGLFIVRWHPSPARASR